MKIILQSDDVDRWVGSIEAGALGGAWQTHPVENPQGALELALREIVRRERTPRTHGANIYRARRENADENEPLEPVATVNGRLLPLRLDLANHSPTGFEWGYSGSGPAQLALAILACEFHDEFALEHYQLFKDRAIAAAHKDGFTLTSADIAALLDE